MVQLPTTREERLGHLLDLGWAIFFQRVVSGKLSINKEASMQLHLSSILQGLGELLSVEPGESFKIELESRVQNSNIDIVCAYNEVKAAIELKCFKTTSNRATDLDMYDALKDISRLNELTDFQVKRFICLTDNEDYPWGRHVGHAACVSIHKDKCYAAGSEIIPTWIGKWKNRSRDKAIPIKQELIFDWVHEADWFYLNLKL